MTYSTAEVAEMVGVSKNTLLRWIAEERLRDVARDWRNWREWRDEDVARARAVRDEIHGLQPKLDPASPKVERMHVYHDDLTRLGMGREYRAK